MKRAWFAILTLAGLALALWYFMTHNTKKDKGTPSQQSAKDMLDLSPIDVETAKLYASNAGFDGDALDTIVAIARAESSLDPMATLENKDDAGNVRSVDRGILQINDRWHPEVSDLEAYNPVTAFQAGYRISNGGTKFSDWVTYNTGAYRRYLNVA